MAERPDPIPEPTMDPNGLYREEIYTDRQVGTIRVLVPVTPDGAADVARPTIYSGEAQIMTSMGPLPINFDIEARNLRDAVAGYAAAAKVGIERTVRDLQEMRRQAASSIVVPGQGGFDPGAMPGAGLGGGSGRIRMP